MSERKIIPIRQKQVTCQWFFPPTNGCKYDLGKDAPSMARDILADKKNTRGVEIPIARRCTVPPGHPDCSGHQDYTGSTRP